MIPGSIPGAPAIILRGRMSGHLDAKGLKCPLPVLRARKAIKSVEIGSELKVLATDSAAPKDFKAFCSQTGHLLISMKEYDGVFEFVLRRSC